jgi:hypothetical protein
MRPPKNNIMVFAIGIITETYIRSPNMSDKIHTGQQKVPFWLDKDQLEKLDKIINEYGYTSRVEWFRAMVREEILDYEKMKASHK